METHETGSKISVTIPDELAEFMRDVYSCIKSKDDAARIPSDDLLQCAHGYGGLSSDGKHYSFVYFPERGMRDRWEFKLLADEIDEIGSGWRKELIVRRFERTDETA
jgi:hypothetical protein